MLTITFPNILLPYQKYLRPPPTPPPFFFLSLLLFIPSVQFFSSLYLFVERGNCLESS
jgi:hypothetical protein